MEQDTENIYILESDDNFFQLGVRKRKNSNVVTQLTQDVDDMSKFLLPKMIKLKDPITEISREVESTTLTEDTEFELPTDDIDATLLEATDDTEMAVLGGEEEEAPGVFVEHMDVRSPLSVLREQLEKRLSCDLSDHQFWLQDTQMLEPHKNLVQQCLQAEGLVQINVELKYEEGRKRINIVDVLKPSTDYLDETEKPDEPEEDTTVRWVIDNHFGKEFGRLKMPQDPVLWSSQQVKLWILWAVRQFNLRGVKLTDWEMSGTELLALSQAEFKMKVPKDQGDLFWTHFELLRKCKFIAVIQKPKPGEENSSTTKQVAFIKETPTLPPPKDKKQKPKDGKKISRVLGTSSISVNDGRTGVGNRTGNNGQIQLWQFLLDLLTSKHHRDVIQWITDDGEFKLNNPEMVARLWGQRKNKPAMTYEKLSRALRYYYDGDMISKVHGKRFVYKFVCDLKQLLGYSAMELNQLVTESALKAGLETTYCDFYEHPQD